MTPENSSIKFTQLNVEKVFTILISVDNELKEHFDKYLEVEYKDNLAERLDYIDMSEIARFLIDKLQKGQTKTFQDFFSQVELILTNCDSYVDNLIVIGLFEGIQNQAGRSINYYTGFNKWLKTKSKIKWDDLIIFWEGNKWKKVKK